jgi:hypothetical protein
MPTNDALIERIKQVEDEIAESSRLHEAEQSHDPRLRSSSDYFAHELGQARRRGEIAALAALTPHGAEEEK